MKTENDHREIPSVKINISKQPRCLFLNLTSLSGVCDWPTKFDGDKAMAKLHNAVIVRGMFRE